MQKSITEIGPVQKWRDLTSLAYNPIPVISRNLAEHGGIYRVSTLLSPNIIMTNKPEVIGHVLQKNNKNYYKSPLQTEGLGKYLGKGLLTVNGEYWLRQRRLIQPGFHRKKLAELAEIMMRVIDKEHRLLDHFAAEQKSFDMSEYMMELTYKVVVRSLFGTETDESSLKRMGHIIDFLQDLIINRNRKPYLRPWYWISRRDQQGDKMKAEVDDFVRGVIQQRKDSGEEHGDLLDMLLSSRYEDTGEAMSIEQIKDEALVLIAAGHETSANALTWLFKLLIEHPRVIDKVRQEVAEVCPDGAIEFEDMPKLSYTKQVIQEGMRLYPPAWAVDRIALEDDEVQGYKIPKGSLIISFIYGVHRRADLWSDPTAFIPERFDKERAKQFKKFQYLPFGGGPRLCIGNSFAMMEMQMIVATLLSRYEFNLVPKQDIETLPLITLRSRHGIKMKVKHRRVEAVV